MRTNRTKYPYIDGVAAFLKYAVHQLKILRNMDPLNTREKNSNSMSMYVLFKPPLP